MKKIIESLPNKTPAERSAMRENARKMAESGDPKKLEQAEAFLAALDEYEAGLAAAEYDRLSSLDDVGKIREAFERVPPSDTEINLIKVLAENPGGTSGQLSAAMGWKGLTWHLHFGYMGKDREAYLWPAPPSKTRRKPDGEPEKFYSGMFASYDAETSGFTLKPEARAAFVALGLIKGEAS
ncbi:MAG: hypothetical protein JJ884_07000 [Maricaulis sp.]|uniref:hypothetical protein n=1 Tax=Maricaulis sp. TaxID=1486257 RepID=UPI001B1C5AF7|nr:hypothetical protein [Maricaulis sp.]MBO6728233.1 hypothetical protein [Maricaulis sp.]MBO6847251.1 hypothetical protein [Maricaulis sp.]MBO6876550.1 hypothetical protein [Maricaulis sp.]